MNILEKEIEDVVWDTFKADPKLLRNRGLYMDGVGFRQINLGGYGIADIVTVELERVYDGRGNKFNTIVISVYELKKEEINIDTYLQAIRYCKGIEELIDSFEMDLSNTTIKYNIKLIGKTINTKDSFVYCSDFHDNLFLYTYSIDIVKGLIFKHSYNWSLTSPNIPESSKSLLGINLGKQLIKIFNAKPKGF